MTFDWPSTIMSALGLVTGGTAFVRVLFLNREPSLTAKPKTEKLVKVMYILGDMRGRSIAELQDAVARCQQQYVNMLQCGIYPVGVPVNTPYEMREYAVPAMFEEAGKEMIRRADGVLLLEGWDNSPESKAVHDYAVSFKKQIFRQGEGHLREKLRAWSTAE